MTDLEKRSLFQTFGFLRSSAIPCIWAARSSFWRRLCARFRVGGALAAVACLAWRLVAEERYLSLHLPGYDAYREHTATG
jgi:hypothetical protein